MLNYDFIISFTILPMLLSVVFYLFKAKKRIKKLFINSIISFIFIGIINLVSTLFGFSIKMNILNIIIAIILGVPGIVMIILFS